MTLELFKQDGFVSGADPLSERLLLHCQPARPPLGAGVGTSVEETYFHIAVLPVILAHGWLVELNVQPPVSAPHVPPPL